MFLMLSKRLLLSAALTVWLVILWQIYVSGGELNFQYWNMVHRLSGGSIKTLTDYPWATREIAMPILGHGELDVGHSNWISRMYWLLIFCVPLASGVRLWFIHNEPGLLQFWVYFCTGYGTFVLASVFFILLFLFGPVVSGLL